MKKTAGFLMLFLIFNAQANSSNEMASKTLDEKKATITKNLEERIKHLNQMKACVANAKDDASLEDCRSEMKEMRHEMKKNWKKKRKSN
jgi:galactokinase/mevalonate kinase-like predicted kinase